MSFNFGSFFSLDDYVTERVRFDRHPAFEVTFRAGVSGLNNYLQIGDDKARSFIDKMKAGNILLFELTSADGNPVFEIPLRGFTAQASKLPCLDRPTTPLIVEDDLVDDDITIELVTLDAIPVEDLPPPPEEAETDISQQYVFTPVEVNPSLRNGAEIRRQLDRVYPAILKEAGIGGSSVVNFFLDEEGNVVNSYLRETSGHSSLDDAALSVAYLFKFSPAMNRDKPVAVWTYLPVTFTAN